MNRKETIMSEEELVQMTNRFACAYILEAIENIEHAQKIMMENKQWYKEKKMKKYWKLLPSDIRIGDEELYQDTLYDFIKNIDIEIVKKFKESLLQHSEEYHELLKNYAKKSLEESLKSELLSTAEEKSDEPESK